MPRELRSECPVIEQGTVRSEEAGSERWVGAGDWTGKFGDWYCIIDKNLSRKKVPGTFFGGFFWFFVGYYWNLPIITLLYIVSVRKFRMGAIVYRFCWLFFPGRAARFLLLLLRYNIHFALLLGEKCVRNQLGDGFNSITISGDTLNGISISGITVIKVTPPYSFYT